MGVTAAANWNSKKYGLFTLQKMLPFPWDPKEDVVLIGLQEIEAEVIEKNKAFWARVDAKNINA